MPSPTTCPKCGAPVAQPGSRFCMGCGAALTAPTSAIQVVEPSKRTARPVLWLIPSVLLVLALATVLAYEPVRTAVLRRIGAGTPAAMSGPDSTAVMIAATQESMPRARPVAGIAQEPSGTTQLKATTAATTATIGTADAQAQEWSGASMPHDISSIIQLAPYEMRRFGRGALNDFAISPRGDLLAVATGLGVWLYRPDEPQENGKLLANGSIAAAVSWSPDGTQLAVLEFAGQIQVWDPHTGVIERTIGSCGGHLPSDLEWSPDGARLAALCGDGAALLDAVTGKWLSNCAYPIDNAQFSWSPDGKHTAIAVMDYEGQMRWGLDICSAETGKPERSLVAASNSEIVDNVAWSPDGLAVAAVVRNSTGRSTDGTGQRTLVRIWEPISGSLMREHEFDGFVSSFAWSPDGQRLAVGQDDHINLVDSSLEESFGVINTQSHMTSSDSVAWSPDGTLIVAGSQEGAVSVWDADSGTLVGLFPGHSSISDAFAWSSDGSRVAAVTFPLGALDILDASTGKPLTRHLLPGALVRSLSPDWSEAAVQDYAANQLQVKILQDELVKCELAGSTGSANTDMAWSPDGKLIAHYLDSTALQVSNAGDCTPVGQVSETSSIQEVTWSPDGQRIAYITNSGSTVRVWGASSVGNGLPWTADLDTQISALAWSPDAKNLAALNSSSYLLILETGYRQPRELLRVRLEVGQDSAHRLAWSPDGSRIAVGTSNGRLLVIDAATGQLLLVLSGHNIWVEDLYWSPDSIRLLSGAGDGTLRIWDVSSTASLVPATTRQPASTPPPDSVGLGSNEKPSPATDSVSGQIVFLSSRDYSDFRADMPNNLRPHDIYAMNADGSGVRRITTGLRLYNVHSPVVSPDGSQIIIGGYNRDSGARIFSASGELLQSFPLPGTGGWALDWLPNGKVLFCIFMESGLSEEIYSVDSETGASTRLTNDSARNLFASWSPDGRQIAFMRDYTLWVMNADGTGQRQVVEGEARDLDWSPDGAMIAMESSETPGMGMDFEIYLVRSDGTGRRSLTNSPDLFLYNPSWSPDGMHLAVESYADNPPREGQISVVDVQTGVLTQVTSVGNNFAPFWAPND